MKNYKQFKIEGMKDYISIDESISDIIEAIFVLCNMCSNYKYNIEDKIYDEEVRLVIFKFKDRSNNTDFDFKISVSYNKVKRIFFSLNSPKLEKVILEKIGKEKGNLKNIKIENPQSIKEALTILMSSLNTL
jgi:hypothetical protein